MQKKNIVYLINNLDPNGYAALCTWLKATEKAFSMAGFCVFTYYIRSNVMSTTVNGECTTKRARHHKIFSKKRTLLGKIFEHIISMYTIFKDGRNYDYICPVFCRKPSYLLNVYRHAIHTVSSKYVTISLDYPLLDQHLGTPAKQEKYMRSISNVFDIIITITTSIKELYSKYGRTKPVFLTPIIVDTARFKVNMNAASGIRNLCYCGNLQHQKEIHLLLDSFDYACNSIPNLQLKIIGGGQNDEHTNALITIYKKHTNRFSNPRNILFTGTLPRSMIPNEYANVDLFILPRPFNLYSKHGFPTKLGEYLATGEPVVAIATGDIPQYLTDGDSAFLTSSEDPADLSDKILSALADPQQASRIGLRGREVAVQQFSVNAMANRIKEYFE